MENVKSHKGFHEYLNKTRKGYKLPNGVSLPKTPCFCGCKKWDIGLSSIRCSKCGDVAVIWHVSLKSYRREAVFNGKKNM